MWRLWCKALGEKAGKNDREADNVAYIRTFIFLTYLITNIAIVANAVRHWNDEPVINVEIVVSEKDVPSDLSQTQKERILQTNSNFAYD